MIDLGIILFLILLNGFIVLCETALIAAKKNRLEISAARGDSKSKTVLELKENPDIFLSTVQIYITLIAILTGIFSGERLSKYLAPYIKEITALEPYANTIATVIIVVLVTFVSILFGELVPKRLAMFSPEMIAKNVAKPIKFLSRISHPLVWLLSWLNSGIFRLFNMGTNADSFVT